MKYNWNWKRTLMAVGLVGTLVVGVAAADAVRRNVTAEIRPDITVKVNGDEQNLKDGNGNAVYPIIYNGSTYLPIRAVGQLAGMTVGWDDDTQTVILNDDGSSTSGGTSTGTYIGKERAKEIALNHAGLSYSNVTFFRVELDWDDGKPEYEVEFYSGNKEYDYEIAAADGKVLDYDYDAEHYAPSSSTGTAMSVDEAKAIALKHAGVSASSATFQKAELDRDDGRLEYELEFRSGGVEYEYKLDAVNGTILEAERDHD